MVWVSIHIRPVLPGAMDEIPCVQGPEIARGALPLRRLGGRGQAKPDASTRSPRAVVKLAGRRQDPDINPDRVAGRNVLIHAVYRHIGCAVPPRRSLRCLSIQPCIFRRPVLSIK